MKLHINMGVNYMKANINNISYVENELGYHIVTEFSRLAIESFQEEKEVKEFIAGYLYGKTKTPTNIKGKLFKVFVDTDIRLGVEYKKVREIASILIEV